MLMMQKHLCTEVDAVAKCVARACETCEYTTEPLLETTVLTHLSADTVKVAINAARLAMVI